MRRILTLFVVLLLCLAPASFVAAGPTQSAPAATPSVSPTGPAVSSAPDEPVAKRWPGQAIAQQFHPGVKSPIEVGEPAKYRAYGEWLVSRGFRAEMDPELAQILGIAAPAPADEPAVETPIAASPKAAPKIGQGVAAGFSAKAAWLEGGAALSSEPCLDLVWRSRAPMPTARWGLGAAVVGGKIYAIGGTTNFDALNTVEVYDPATDTWDTCANMPTERACMGVVATDDGKILAIGGIDDAGSYLTTVEEYDPATDTWRARASMPTPRYYVGVAASNGRIYAMGGENGMFVPVAAVEEYDPATDTWSTRSDMLTPRWGFGVATASNGHIYAIGGTSGWSNMCHTTVDEYDPATDAWTKRADMPTCGQGAGVASADSGCLYAIGRYQYPYTILPTVEKYSPTADAWAASTSMTTPRWHAGVVMLHGSIFVIGGNIGVEGGTSVVEEGFIEGAGNTAPTVGPIGASLMPIAVGSSVTTSAAVTDPDAGDTHTALWAWGDGSVNAGIVTDGQVSGSHSYSTPGVYTIYLTVTDAGGLSAQAQFEYVVIYDPDGGFVTGGGWINSPAGAYVADPALSGKAHFNFEAKYHKRAQAPKGQTKFKLQAANLEFDSGHYDWLVVSGAKAQCQGTGQINGQGEYGFMLTAIDGKLSGGGGTDKFRIKIWDKATDALVYDNQLGASDTADPITALGGGSIVVHK